jgi:hypothetical protein
MRPPPNKRIILRPSLKQLAWGYNMAKIIKKSFNAPKEIRSFHKSKIEVVDLGPVMK